MVTTLDKYGRIIIPKRFRERLGITAETNLHIAEEGNKIIIEPLSNSQNAPLADKEGILIVTSECKIDIGELIKSERKKRLNRLTFWDNQ